MARTEEGPRAAARTAPEEGLRSLRRLLLRVPGMAGSLRALVGAGLLSRRIWGRLKVDTEIELPVPGGTAFRYQVGERDPVGQGLYWQGLAGYEPETVPVFLERVRGARLFLDVGAYTGLFSLLAAAASTATRVVAVEALPGMVTRLRDHVRLNGWGDRIEVLPVAASDRDGTAILHVPAAEMTTQASLAAPSAADGPRSGVTVETVRLDRVVEARGWGPVDLVKIDVEGAEPLVLAGMAGILERDRPSLIVEVNPGGPREQIEAILGPLGYRYLHLGSRGPVAVPGLEAPSTEVHRNFLCEARDRG